MKKLHIIKSFTLVCLLLFTGTISAQQMDHVLNEALVRLVPGTDKQQFQKDLRQFNGVETKCRVLRKVSKQLNIYLINFDHIAVNEYEFRDHIFRHPAVEVVQVNHLLTNRQTVPDDPEIGTQWQWINPNDADIDMDLAWDITTGGQTANGDDIVVAVFDDGGDLDHPDLIDNNWINIHEIAGNGIDDDNNGYIDDVNGWNFGANNNNVDGGGHGVNVAGMIGAVGNNANQGTGVNWNVKIMNIRRSGVQESQVIEFYSYALDHRQRYTNSNGLDGAFVVATNSSWGIDGGDPNSAPLWCAFYDTLGVNGILSCGATANNNVNIDVVGDLPTACPSEYMVAVTATNNQDNRTFSGYGATTIDVGAPGEDIYTTSSGGGYQFTSGTSFASPTTAGVIGLLYSAPCSNIATLAMSDPQLAAEQVRDYLFEGSEFVGNLAGDVVYGRINAFNSLQLLMAGCGPCPAPSGISVTDLVDVQGTVSWTNPQDAQDNNLRYRETGTANWTEILDVTAPYSLSGLMACTEYEVQIDATCSDTVSGYSASYVFTTDGCCVAPDDLSISDITDNAANATWSPIFAAESYNIRIREVGTTPWAEANLTDPGFLFVPLLPCVIYEVQIQTVCANETTPYTESVIFSTFGCGACTDFTFCQSEGDDVGDEWISEVVIGPLTNLTPDMPLTGYSDFTGTPSTATLETYSTYAISLTPAYSGQTWNEYFKIWIDYNQDGIFDESTELAFDAGGLVDETITGSTTIPGTALTGLTRMRIVMRYNGAPDACGTYAYGETEDYCLTIEEGIPSCDPPTGLNVTAITESTATLNWTAATIADSYNIEYREMGAAVWIETTSTTTSADITGLFECLDYEYRVQSVCTGDMSPFSDIETFLTICSCAPPTNLDANNLGTDVATLSWVAATNADSYQLRYKLFSGAIWTEQTINALNVTINDLIDCSDYEYQVRTNCPNSESDWSDPFDFSTECFSCAPPTGLDTTNVGFTLATLSWTAADNADSYGLRYKLISGATWAEQTISAISLTINNLLECSGYEYQVRTNCGISQSDWSDSFNFETACTVFVNEVDNGIALLEVFPNPFTNTVVTRFTLSENTDLTLEVYSATGQLLAQDQYVLNVGQQSISVNGLDKVSAGIYFITMTTAEGTKVRKVIKY